MWQSFLLLFSNKKIPLEITIEWENWNALASVSGQRTSSQCSRSCSSSGSRAAGRLLFGWNSAWSYSTWESRSTEQHTCLPSLRRMLRETKWYTTRGHSTAKLVLRVQAGGGKWVTRSQGHHQWNNLPYKLMSVRQWRHFLKPFQIDVFEENTGRHQKLFSLEDCVHGQPKAGS